MKFHAWDENVSDISNRYRSVASLEVDGAYGAILHIPSFQEAMKLPIMVATSAWECGLCCACLYQPGIEEAMENNAIEMGFRCFGEKDGSWVALFRKVERRQIFPIIASLSDEFDGSEIALIQALFADVSWCAPLDIIGRYIKIGVSDEFNEQVDVGKWYGRYRDVSRALFGSAPIRSDFLSTLNHDKAVLFVGNT
jgi:hypothetical protein